MLSERMKRKRIKKTANQRQQKKTFVFNNLKQTIQKLLSAKLTVKILLDFQHDKSSGKSKAAECREKIK